jgi:hypothetical protein
LGLLDYSLTEVQFIKGCPILSFVEVTLMTESAATYVVRFCYITGGGADVAV